MFTIRISCFPLSTPPNLSPNQSDVPFLIRRDVVEAEQGEVKVKFWLLGALPWHTGTYLAIGDYD